MSDELALLPGAHPFSGVGSSIYRPLANIRVGPTVAYDCVGVLDSCGGRPYSGDQD